MTFEEYLTSKKIDLEFFQKAEPVLFENWKEEFAQMHPNSFSAQKLYLINPIRRKYPLKIVASVIREEDIIKPELTPSTDVVAGTLNQKTDLPSKPARPVFKPKPKIS